MTSKQVPIQEARTGMRKLRTMVLTVITWSQNQTFNNTLKGFPFGTLSTV